jgi:hypothetical protein
VTLVSKAKEIISSEGMQGNSLTIAAPDPNLYSLSVLYFYPNAEGSFLCLGKKGN